VTKILVCDDEEGLRLLYEEDLTDAGYEVVVASNGREALAMVESEKPDLVVLDIRMPGMDGLEAMGNILGKHNRLPVILNTAYSSYRDNFMSWSADAYVVKSADTTELLKTIERVLKERAAKQPTEDGDQ
jgi:DNA-binding NtrC family response regulator